MGSWVSRNRNTGQDTGCQSTSSLKYYEKGKKRLRLDCEPKSENYVKTEPEVEGYAKTEPEVEGYAKTEPEVEGYAKTEPEDEGYAKTEPEVEGYVKTEPEVEGNVNTSEPKGKWFCAEHKECCKHYCQKHDIALCLRDPLAEHGSCPLRGLEDVIQENKKTLLNLRERLVNYRCPEYGVKIEKSKINVDDRLKKMETEVNAVCNEAIKTNIDKEKEAVAKINKEIDERSAKLHKDIMMIEREIKNNGKEREQRLDQNHVMSEGRQLAICNEHVELFVSVRNIAEKVWQNIADLEKSWKEIARSEEEATKLLNTVLHGGEEAIVQKTKRVETSMSALLSKKLDQDALESIIRTASSANFVKREGRERYIGKITELGKGWKYVDSIKITDQIKEPIIVGYKDDGKVIITDSSQGRKDTYTLNMETKHIQRVITGSDVSYVVSCAQLKDGKVACGRYIDGPPANTLSACISVYDSQWKLINNISKPRDNKQKPTRVYVAANPKGEIIACELGQRMIYVIDPVSGKTISTIRGMDAMALRGVQSSEHIVAQTSPADNRVFLIEREELEDALKHDDLILNVGIDPVTDDVYGVTSEDDCMTYIIWNLNGDDDDHTDNDEHDRIAFPLCDKLTNIGNTRAHTKTRRNHLETSCMIILSSMM